MMLDPDQTAEIALPSDDAKPRDKRPVFMVRALTKRQEAKFLALWRLHDETDDAEKRCDIADQALGMAIVGARNGAPCNQYSDKLNGGEIAFLLLEIAKLCRLTGAEKKESAPPSASVSPNSGGTATGETGGA